MHKIILVGYMGVGKTTISQLLAQKTGYACVDLDQKIEKEENATISEIFKQKGEIYFRRKESQWFKELVTSPGNLIISTGGGTPCYADNHMLLNGKGVVSVYLKASIDLLFERLRNNTKERPLVAQYTDTELKEFIAKNLFDRSYFYNQSTYIVTVDGKLPETIADEILQILS
ncbi:shikimate kinase [Flavobacterium sedimenticola]|uniref:Shikimate kinase n=1 Tax=Flavobacterium sedimenticola TaxID=3043286 RepID=A0ABT6XNJ0_9FLAO|nr:shikimate kinase [Flavobacterium sedimenticola]MDI9256664.1 shikimate kinase [Flavobacterium sedimenticola]